MPRIEESVRVDAPPETVFAYLAEPNTHLEIMPNLIDVGTSESRPNGGSRGPYTFKMLGARLAGEFEDVTYAPPRRREYRLRGDVEGLMSYTIEPTRGDSDVTIVSYGGPRSGYVRAVDRSARGTVTLPRMEAMAENLELVIEGMATGSRVNREVGAFPHTVAPGRLRGRFRTLRARRPYRPRGDRASRWPAASTPRSVLCDLCCSWVRPDRRCSSGCSSHTSR